MKENFHLKFHTRNFQIIGFSLVWRNHVYAIMFQVALSLEISRQK